MKHKSLFVSLFVLFVTVFGVVIVDAQGPRPGTRAPGAAMGTAFTYQGQLKSGGSSVNGACDLQFGLYDALTAGTQLGSTQTQTSVSVTNGLFTVTLNGSGEFGANAFDGNARWLDISVRCPAGSGSYTTLSPRQELTAAPYAHYAKSAPWGGLTGTPSAWTLAGNSGTVEGTNFLGTTDNVALNLRVNNQRALRLEPNATSPNLIGGYSGNTVTSGVMGATIGGGGVSGGPNRVTDDFGTVSGGYGNWAGDGAGTTSDKTLATVGGGWANAAFGNAATISGGYFNTASGSATTVGGGYDNIPSGDYATVGGGYVNTASNQYATVPGGRQSDTSHYGEMAYASGKFATTGDAQTSVYVLRNSTSDAMLTELFLDGSAQRITIASNRTLTFDILITARSSGGASAGYQVLGVIENVSSTTALVGAITKRVLGEDDIAWDATVEADNTNDALVIKVTGAAAATIRWVATARTVEVGY